MTWSTGVVLQLVAGALMLVVAGSILALRFNDRAVRAFATLLVLRALVATTYTLGGAASSAEAAAFWWRTTPYFVLPLLCATVAFALFFPRPLARGRGVALAALGSAVLAAELAYVLEHALFWDLSAPLGGRGPQVAAAVGPLFVAYALFEVGYAIVAWLCIREWRRARPGPRRTSILLVGIGFAVVVVYDTLGILLLVPEFVTRHAPPMRAALGGSLVVALAIAAWTVVCVAARARAPADEATRREARRCLVAFSLPVLSVGFSLAVEGALPSLAPLDQAFAGLWRLVLPVLVGYALVRHNLFDIDLRIKWGVARGTVAAAFAVVFFVVAEAAQQFLSDAYGYLVGGGAAALLLLGIHPLQRAASRVSDAVLPRVADTPGYRAYRKLVVYRAAVEGAWTDDELTPREMEVLRRLREELGVSAEDAAAVEADVLAKGRPEPTTV